MQQFSQIIKEFRPADLAAVAAPLVVFAAVQAWAKVKPKQANWVAYWFLFNGIIIHLFLDGLVGGFKLVPPLFRQYATLDSRYQKEDPLVMLVCYLEICVMFPLCVLTYRALATRRPEAPLLQLVTSLIQLLGTYFFTLQEVLGGFKHVPIDRKFEFNFHFIFYFWIFFVAANILWSALPLYLIHRAWAQIAPQLKVKGN